MKHLVLTLFSSLIVSNLLCAQEIRAAGDKMPAVRKTTTAGTPATYKLRQIIVGKGGGITGASTTYYLLENGKLFGRRNRDVAYTYIGQQTAVNTIRVFTSVEVNCKIKKTKFDNPGNIYTFVQWRKGKQDYKVSWGAADKTVPANYPKVYDSFMSMIPASLRLN